MALKLSYSSALASAVCLLLVITSAGNFKVSAAAQQYEAKTLTESCPNSNTEFTRVKMDILEDIGPFIEQLSETSTTQSPTEGQTTEQSISTTTELPDTCGGPGWRQVAFINMTDSSYDCPPGLNLTSYSRRTCGRVDSTGCHSTTFSTGITPYNQVCGRVLGYQVGQTNAFDRYLSHNDTIEGSYVDGVSLTHKARENKPRQHIWTFAVGPTEIDDQRALQQSNFCPCDTTNPEVVPPTFVGNDYFCESGVDVTWPGLSALGMFFPDDPLWDGEGCTPSSSCCQFNNPPWFTRTLPGSATDDIELRVCLSSVVGNNDVAVELIELYVM